MAVQVETINWESSLQRAQELGKREAKPVLVDFSAAPQ
jgi:hypothetical protein